MPEAKDPPVIALVRDLMLGSRISGTAGNMGVALRTIRDPTQLASVAGHRLLVDLNLEGAIEAAASWKAGGAGRQVIGFVSHVDAETARRAREAGIDRILARSRFVEVLPDALCKSDREPEA